MTGTVQRRVAAVIVNYNAGAHLRACIESLLQSDDPSDIVVVDNLSLDGSLRDLPEDGRLRVVRLNANHGFAVAVNRGAAEVPGHDLLLVNPDCELRPPDVRLLREFMEAQPGAGICGPLILGPDGVEQRGCRRRLPTPARALGELPVLHRFLSGFNLTGEPLPASPVRVEAVSGACLLIRREAFDALRGMDENYFLHFEDLDLCARAAESGWECWFVPAAVARHEKGVSSRSRPVFVLWHKHRGMWRFFRRHALQKRSWYVTGLAWAGVWARFALLVPVASARYWAARFAG